MASMILKPSNENMSSGFTAFASVPSRMIILSDFSIQHPELNSIYLFVWLSQILVVAHRDLRSLLWDVGSLFLFCKFIFNWRIIALQNFVVFCQTSTWISHRYTYVPSLLSLPPTSLHPTPLGWYRTPVWVPWDIQQIPIGCLFYI